MPAARKLIEMAESPSRGRRAAIEVMIAYRNARDKCIPGSKMHKELDRKYREAEAAFRAAVVRADSTKSEHV